MTVRTVCAMDRANLSPRHLMGPRGGCFLFSVFSPYFLPTPEPRAVHLPSYQISRAPAARHFPLASLERGHASTTATRKRVGLCQVRESAVSILTGDAAVDGIDAGVFPDGEGLSLSML